MDQHIKASELSEVLLSQLKAMDTALRFEETGKVLQVSPKEGKVIVEGINVVSKHVKPRKMGEPGGIIKAESALYASKVQLICPKCGRPTRVGHVIVEEKGEQKKMRVCKKADCGAKFE